MFFATFSVNELSPTSKLPRYGAKDGHLNVGPEHVDGLGPNIDSKVKRDRGTEFGRSDQLVDYTLSLVCIRINQKLIYSH